MRSRVRTALCATTIAVCPKPAAGLNHHFLDTSTQRRVGARMSPAIIACKRFFERMLHRIHDQDDNNPSIHRAMRCAEAAGLQSTSVTS